MPTATNVGFAPAATSQDPRTDPIARRTVVRRRVEGGDRITGVKPLIAVAYDSTVFRLPTVPPTSCGRPRVPVVTRRSPPTELARLAERANPTALVSVSPVFWPVHEAALVLVLALRIVRNPIRDPQSSRVRAPGPLPGSSGSAGGGSGTSGCAPVETPRRRLPRRTRRAAGGRCSAHRRPSEQPCPAQPRSAQEIFACRSRIVASCSDGPGDPPRANTSSNPSTACRFQVPTWFGWTSCLAAIRLHRSVPPQRLERHPFLEVRREPAAPFRRHPSASPRLWNTPCRLSENPRPPHSGRVGLASELTSRGASTTDVMLAGNWKTSRMVAHYSAGATAQRGAVARYL